MKRLRRLLSLLLACALLLTLCACGEESVHDAREGRYEAVSAEALGFSLSLAGLFPDGFAIELGPDGKAQLCYSGDRYTMSWRCEDGVFHAEGADAALDGTLVDGVMRLTDVLGSGVDLTLVCPELAGPAAAEPDEAVGESPAPEENSVPEESAIPEPMLDALATLPVFDSARTREMSNRINYGYALVSDGVCYGRHHLARERSTHLMALRLTPDGRGIAQASSLDTGCSPGFLQLQNGTLYYLRYARGEGSALGIGSVPLEGGAPRVLAEGDCGDLNVTATQLVYTEDNARVVRLDLDGGARRVLLEREVYYLSMLDDDWMLFQDDADNESLHLYYLPEGLDYKLNDEPSYSPILCGHVLFYAVRAAERDGAFHLARIDLDAWEAVEDATRGCRVPRFTAERSEALFGGEFSCDGALLLPANDAAAVPLDQWRALSDDAYLGFRRAIRFLSESLCVVEELDPKNQNIRGLLLVDRGSGETVTLPAV